MIGSLTPCLPRLHRSRKIAGNSSTIMQYLPRRANRAKLCPSGRAVAPPSRNRSRLLPEPPIDVNILCRLRPSRGPGTARHGRSRTAALARRGSEYSRLAHRAPLCRVCAAGGRALAERRFKELDDVFWTIIPFGTGGRRGKMYPIGSNAINDRTIGERRQGLADYVRGTVTGPYSSGIAYDTRHRLAALRRAVRRGDGRGRLHGLLSRRLSQHARAVVPGALQAVLLRHHGHGQPQSAQRQRGEGLLVDRRAVAAAARPGRDRLRDVDPHDPPRAVCRGAGPRPSRDLPGRGRPGVHRCSAGAGLFRTARLEDHLLAAARRGRVGRAAGAGGRRFSRRGGVRPACHARRRLSQRAGPRRQSREQGRFRFDHRPSLADASRLDPGQRSRLRPHRAGRAAVDRSPVPRGPR